MAVTIQPGNKEMGKENITVDLHEIFSQYDRLINKCADDLARERVVFMRGKKVDDYFSSLYCVALKNHQTIKKRGSF